MKGGTGMGKFKFDKSNLKTLTGIGIAVAMGIATVFNKLADQRKEDEFEEMKRTLSELQKK